MQHDVSAANLLIVKRIPGQRVPFTGFLHDFDYSIMTPDIPLEKDRPLSPEELHDLLRKTIDRNVLCEHIVSTLPHLNRVIDALMANHSF